ncbi:hypothetical protein [uncultured Xylophilus sp.]|uniref:hypothetical protein n=1 Tax=uncultured Xylophilus sp. TaxID=296832 RepID=UPI0025E1EB70|nr:hypothetical protein [uncultured Xylophilus sp.]
MDRQQPKKDDRDNRRAFRWGIGGVIAVVAAVLVYNVATFSRGDPRVPDNAAGMSTPAAGTATGSR